jgi:hypothetical protein
MFLTTYLWFSVNTTPWHHMIPLWKTCIALRYSCLKEWRCIGPRQYLHLTFFFPDLDQEHDVGHCLIYDLKQINKRFWIRLRNWLAGVHVQTTTADCSFRIRTLPRTVDILWRVWAECGPSRSCRCYAEECKHVSMDTNTEQTVHDNTTI